MRSVWLSLLAITFCGGIGAAAGWSLAILVGASGIGAVLVAIFIAAPVAAGIWVAGVALLDWFRRR